jgi:hypothetical protein
MMSWGRSKIAVDDTTPSVTVSAISFCERGFLMTPTTRITLTARTTLLCAGLITASAVWSCPEDTAAANPANPAAKQAQTPPSETVAQPSLPSATRLYAVLHDPALNKPDGLANYAEDYRGR